MAIYESIFIMDSLVPPKDIDTAVERFSGIITENGGKVRKVDKLGKKRMAFEIQKKQYGYYVSLEFEGTGDIPTLLESDYNFNDKVLRYLTYRYDKNKLKLLKLKEDKNEALKAPEPKPKPAPAPVRAVEPEEMPEVIETSEESPVETDVESNEERGEA